jgi:hypothetical protein
VVDRWTRREFGPEGLARLAMTTVREAVAHLRKLPQTLDRLDAAILKASEPAPAPVVAKQTPAWVWFVVGLVVASLGAATLWFAMR